eukprot:TRINITY_DN4862_c0_g1_i1.p1 TRINITY_DN4862_c0_g1~~TRINITY_DN4862_c0_g1_i1.p1  ORF type:complete len:1180 (+),score=417.34 TRINITY_DN4862_c0_g1_i1:68-3541(+)
MAEEPAGGSRGVPAWPEQDVELGSVGGAPKSSSPPAPLFTSHRQAFASETEETASHAISEQSARGGRLFDALMNKLKRKGETRDESRVKLVLIPPLLLLILLLLFYIIYQFLTYETSGPLRVTASIITVLVLMVVCGVAFRKREIPQSLIKTSVIVLMCVSILADLANTGTYEVWLFAILLSDTVILTCRPVSQTLSWMLFLLPTVWIFVRTVEDTVRFGLYAEVPYNEEQPPPEARGWDWGIPSLGVRLCAFVYHHVLTQRFLNSIQKEEDRLREAVLMAQHVTDALVDFDLDRAALLVAAGHSTVMRDNFLKLLDNLRMYRPYLPAFVFVRGTEEDYYQAPDDAIRTDSAMRGSLNKPLDFTVLEAEMGEGGGGNVRELLQPTREGDYEGLLKRRLEVGMRMRKGSLMRVVFETSALDLTSLFQRAAPFAEVLLSEVDSWGGVVVDLKGPVALASWNTHLPCPRYSYHAVRCMTSVSDTFVEAGHSLPHLTFSIASGTLGVGATGGDAQRSPFVLGHPLLQVESMHLLCRCIGVRLLITEAVYEATRTRVNARMVDVIPENPRYDTAADGDDAAQSLIAVYEVLEHPLQNISQYQDAFGALRCGLTDKAVELLEGYLAGSGGAVALGSQYDYQALRVMRLAITARQEKAFLPSPYARYMVGWKCYEADAVPAQPGTLTKLLTRQAAILEYYSPEGDAASPHAPSTSDPSPITPPAARWSGPGPRQGLRGDKPQTQTDVLLSEIRTRNRRNSVSLPDASPLSPVSKKTSNPSPMHVHEPQVESIDCVTQACESETSSSGSARNYLRDVDGSKWYQSEKQLGKGTFGTVWLGMGEDGALVAMKWLKLMTRNKKPDERSDTALEQHDTEETLLMSAPGDMSLSELTPPSQVTTSFLSLRSTADAVVVKSISPVGIQPAHPRSVSPGGCSSDEESLESFDADAVGAVRSEIELLVNLRHDNIVSYLSVARSGNQIVILMEYVSGGSLQTLLEQFGAFPLSSVRRYTKDILRGLCYLHGMQVAHRDFKPGNVLVQIDGQCKITDFGASSVIGEVTGKKIEGTLCYMAPEACRGDTTTASDMWSLGISICQMMTNAVPWPTALLLEPHAFFYKVARLPQADVPEAPETHDADCGAFIRSCLTVDVDARPTAKQLMMHSFLA